MVFGFHSSSGGGKGKKKKEDASAANASAVSASTESATEQRGTSRTSSAPPVSHPGSSRTLTSSSKQAHSSSTSTLLTANKNTAATAGTGTGTGNSTSTSTSSPTKTRSSSPAAGPLKPSLKKSTFSGPTATSSTNNHNPTVVTPTTSPRAGANVRSSNTARNTTSASTPTSSGNTTSRAKHQYTGPIDVDEIPRSPPIDVDDIPRSPHITSGMTPTTTNTTTHSGQISEHSNSTQRTKPGASEKDNTNSSAMVITPTKSRDVSKSSNSNNNSNSPSKPRKRLAVDSTPGTFHAMQQEQMHFTTTTTTTTTMLHTRSAMIARNKEADANNNNDSNTHNNNNINDSNVVENTSIVSLKSGNAQQQLQRRDYDSASVTSGISSWDNGSVISRMSVHIDHFLAEMAVADNAKLEQLAIQEMKHQQILPQKIKKLTAKINVLAEERQVLVGLIEQLSELVEQDKERKKAARRKKKKIKRDKKLQKRKQKQAMEEALQKARTEKHGKAGEEQQDKPPVENVVTMEEGKGDRISENIPAVVTPDKEIQQPQQSSSSSSNKNNSNDMVDSDDELSYLDEVEAKIAQAKGIPDNDDTSGDNKKQSSLEVNDVGGQEQDSPWSPEYKAAADRNGTASDQALYDEDEEDEDDEFAKLWNASYNSLDGGSGSDRDTAAEDKNGQDNENARRATVKASNQAASAEPKTLFDVGDPLSDPMFDEFYNNENKANKVHITKDQEGEDSGAVGREEGPSMGSDSAVTASAWASEATSTSTSRLPRNVKSREVKRFQRPPTSRGLPKRTKSFEDKFKAFQTIQDELDVSEGEDKDGTDEADTDVVGEKKEYASSKKEEEDMDTGDGQEVSDDNEAEDADEKVQNTSAGDPNVTEDGTNELQEGSASEDGKLKEASAVEQEIDDETGHGKPSGTRLKRFGRFAAFQETDTYLPDHMPGSRGPSPTPSMEKVAGHSSSDDSDSDSDDSDDSSVGDGENGDRVLVDDDENEAIPSGSHLLAKQLMSRLKQEEKLKEQEKLQRQLFELHSNSRHRQKGDLDMPSSFHGQTSTSSYAARGPGLTGHRSASMTNVYSASKGRPNLVGGGYRAGSFKNNTGGGSAHLTSMMQNYRQNSYVSMGQSFADEDSFSRLQNSFGGGVADEVSNLRQELIECVEELDQLKEERQFHEAKVRELLGVLERRFDVDDEKEDEVGEEEGDANEATDRELEKAMKEESDEGGSSSAGQKRKRIQSFLLQKVSQCAELAAEVEVLKQQVSAKQAKIEELQPGQSSSNRSGEQSKEAMEEPVPEPTKLESAVSISANLSKDQVEKQLLEKSGECIDLQEQIKALKKQLTEKDEAYEEVHRELFTTNLALGVEVDRKATAQEALDEKSHDYNLLKEEYDEIKARVDKYDEQADTLDEELMAKNALIDEMDMSHRDEISSMKSQMEEKDSKIAGMTKELSELREKTTRLEKEHHEVAENATHQGNLVDELKKALDVESDLKQEAEKKCQALEKENEQLQEDLARAKHENEINKSLIQYKEGSNDGTGIDSAGIQQQVEKLMTENAEMSRELRTMRESEESLYSERERLVANATNMSIMLADSRAKVDFLQMQLEEYKNPMSSSEHGFHSSTGPLSRSAHGFTSTTGSKAADFRNFLSNSSTKLGNQLNNMNGNQPMGDSSERSTGGLGSSVRERNTRFRNFLSRRMGSQTRDEPSGADSAAGGSKQEPADLDA